MCLFSSQVLTYIFLLLLLIAVCWRYRPVLKWYEPRDRLWKEMGAPNAPLISRFLQKAAIGTFVALVVVVFASAIARACGLVSV